MKALAVFIFLALLAIAGLNISNVLLILSERLYLGRLFLPESQKNCWRKCGKKPGPCPDICGDDKICCKKGFDTEGCDGKKGGRKGECVKGPSSGIC